MSESMRLYQVPSPGPLAPRLALTTGPRPSASSLGPRQVLVEVAVASVNPADYKVVELGLASRAMIKYPKTPGMDFSGRAVAVGTEVRDLRPGDRLVGRIDPVASAAGALSEYLVADLEGVARLPEGASLDEAAGLGTVGLTAYQTIQPYVKPGDKVFINGGSGGVGTMCIQIAKNLGCHVTATCSTAKVQRCRDLGADDIIDYKTEDVVARLRELGPIFAVAVDNVGNSPADLYAAADAFLLPGGHFKYVGGALSLPMAMSAVPRAILPTFLGGSKHRFEVFMAKNAHADLKQLADWMGEGKLKVVIEEAFSFDRAAAAYEHLKKGSSAGKILVRVQEQEKAGAAAEKSTKA